MLSWKSDLLVVLGARESRVHGEAAEQVEKLNQGNIPYTHRNRRRMSTQLEQIAIKAKTDRTLRFTSLAHLLTPEFLIETWRQMNRRGASGVDGETTKEFERELEARVQDICARLKSGTYRAPPVRRVDIPKGPGKAGTRPLGIPTVEDRLVQRAVARIVEAVFETDFLDCSYGFRPRRSAHQALRTLRGTLVTKKVRHLYEADIRGYFTHINHQWLMRMVAHRIADGVILRLIGKWLRAGVMQDGVVIRMEAGTPQGGPLSPLLSNVYLHFVLDLWFEKKLQKWWQGEAYLTRFADDFVASFQYKRDAERFDRYLRKRFARFNLELADEKTRLLLFGRFATERKAQYSEKPETFEFLGFTHVCGTDRRGTFAVIRIPAQKSCRKFLARTKKWLAEHRHWKRRDQQRQLTMMLRGFYQYFALPHCKPKLDVVRHEVQLQWVRVLRRRSQRHRLYWCYLLSRSWFELPWAETRHATV
jgi:RNA-directed DNA polymerase